MSGKSKGRREKYVKMRENGMTMAEIAKACGVSTQAVSQQIAVYTPHLSRQVLPYECIYPNIRAWLNSNRIGFTELTRRMGLPACARNIESTHRRLNGKTELRKSDIDKLLEITGMPYEVAFLREEQ